MEELVLDKFLFLFEDFDDHDEEFVHELVKLIEFGFDDFLDVDDYFLFVELGLVKLDFLAEGVDEGINGADVMEVGAMVLACTIRAEEGSVLAVPVHADELFRKVVVLALTGLELEVGDHAV